MKLFYNFTYSNQFFDYFKTSHYFKYLNQFWKVVKEGIIIPNFKMNKLALASVAQWFECQPVNQWVTGSIPSLGHVPGLRARPQ